MTNLIGQALIILATNFSPMTEVIWVYGEHPKDCEYCAVNEDGISTCVIWYGKPVTNIVAYRKEYTIGTSGGIELFTITDQSLTTNKSRHSVYSEGVFLNEVKK